jgi:hypothetical protein
MVGFIVTKSALQAKEVFCIYNGQANVENRIKEAKNTLDGTIPVATGLKLTSRG